MAYWYTYPVYDSDNSDEDIGHISVTKMERQIQAEVEWEYGFFESLGNSGMYQFLNHLHPAVNKWTNAPQLTNGLHHLNQTVNRQTLDVIKSGIKEYYDSDIMAYGDTTWSKEDLLVIFKYATMWVDHHNMGRNDYLNDVCWIASKIMQFQKSDHFIGYPFKCKKFN